MQDYLNMFDYVIATHLPAFYKVNLYNELAKKLKIHVIFIASDTTEKRGKDFNLLQNAIFTYSLLNSGSFQNRNKLTSCLCLVKQLSNMQFKKIIVGGWDLPEFWCAVLLCKKNQNCMALESGIFDSALNGYKRLLKRFFLSRISLVFASGKQHKALLDKLKYSGVIKITQGVGIINTPNKKLDINNGEPFYSGKFLFVGRLTSVKNLSAIIKFFNENLNLHLTIIGVGEEGSKLKAISANNVQFLGAIDNANLCDYFAIHDFLILPSIKESWGLVVEEALNFNIPVIVSDKCGSVDLVEHGKNGLIFNTNNINDFAFTIKSIDQNYFKVLKSGAINFSISDKDCNQIKQYIEF